MKKEVDMLKETNKDLKEKVSVHSFFLLYIQINEMTIMLYQKMEENTKLQSRLDQVAAQQSQLTA
jgi:hypothetical protein